MAGGASIIDDVTPGRRLRQQRQQEQAAGGESAGSATSAESEHAGDAGHADADEVHAGVAGADGAPAWISTTSVSSSRRRTGLYVALGAVNHAGVIDAMAHCVNSRNGQATSILLVGGTAVTPAGETWFDHEHIALATDGGIERLNHARNDFEAREDLPDGSSVTVLPLEANAEEMRSAFRANDCAVLAFSESARVTVPVDPPPDHDWTWPDLAGRRDEFPEQLSEGSRPLWDRFREEAAAAVGHGWDRAPAHQGEAAAAHAAHQGAAAAAHAAPHGAAAAAHAAPQDAAAAAHVGAGVYDRYESGDQSPR